jgi:hypothetical protein
MTIMMMIDDMYFFFFGAGQTFSSFHICLPLISNYFHTLFSFNVFVLLFFIHGIMDANSYNLFVNKFGLLALL